MWNRMESYVIARSTEQIENGKHAKYSDKILKNFFCCICGYIMHVSVYENCRIQSTSVWYKNRQDILNVTTVMTELQLKILVKFLKAQGFVCCPPHPSCIMIYSYHQMCPVLNSKPYWSNKQVVPLLGCCSNAPCSPGNRLVICGDRTFFQLNFLVQSMPEIFLEKIAVLWQH